MGIWLYRKCYILSNNIVLLVTDGGMKRADVERFKFSNSLSYGMFYDRLLGTVW